jgi:superfamily II DNA or RNA helicase
MDYESFIDSKLQHKEKSGLIKIQALSMSLAPFQKDLVIWALKRGKSAIFASTGLGKTRMQLEWARHVCRETGKPVLILAPLAVGAQTVTEAANIGIDACQARDKFAVQQGIAVTNYDRLHKFDSNVFGGVVLDESSIIKHHDAKTFSRLTQAFSDTPYKLCATATPAPNDYTELGTHAEFLGVCSRTEMLAEFFCHDGGDTSVWRLKGHARNVFWRWVASWGALVRAPSDLGYEDGAYKLPPLVHHEHILSIDQDEVFASGFLFAQEAGSMTDRRRARRESINRRVAKCAEQIMVCTCGKDSITPALLSCVCDRSERWVVWCDLNAEQKELEEAFGSECWSIYGSMDIDEKERRLKTFVAGSRRILLTKPKIGGWGLNLQSCARMAFVGVTDSWESYFQAVRREWRFGQKREVHVHIFASEAEGAVVKNLKRKEDDAMKMAEALSAETSSVVREHVYGLRRETNVYNVKDLSMPRWLVSHE